jgi:hypothetical protein
MTGVARPALPFALGFDCYEPVSNQTARIAKADGFTWVGRYLENLTVAERDSIFGAGLGIALLTQATTDVALSAATGAQQGRAEVLRALKLAVPPSVHITGDNEAAFPGSDVPAHSDAFVSAVRAGGYDGAMYVGAPQTLDAAQLYACLADRYWRAGSLVPEPACGWCIIQLSPLDRTMFGGQRVDVDVTCLDFRGRAMVMWWPQ